MPSAGATVTVTSTTDVADGDTSSIAALIATPGPDGVISLREAILAANNTSGSDAISFSIAGPGLKSITPLSVLPTITSPVTIDGYTQPLSSANTLAVGDNSVHLIELNGNGAAFPGFNISAGNSTLRGLVINRFNGNGPANAINVNTNGGNKIEGCFIGVSADGTTAQSNSRLGIDIESSPNNTIGGTTPAVRNVISSNTSGQSILINGISSSGTTIQGNYIGTNAAGTAASAGSVIGIELGSNGGGTGSSNNTIGGTTAAARNVISGNASVGIELFDDTVTGNVIQGNYIGTNATGTAAVGNGTGITLLRTNDTLIGGTVAGAGNLISGNSGDGISLDGSRNLVQGNLIGTDATGTAKVPNGFRGIEMAVDGSNAGSDNTIGGTTPGARNIISGNGGGGNSHGIRLELLGTTSGNLIQGNYIGTDITGTVALGNGGAGIQIFESSVATHVNTIGGTSAAARNIISGNSGGGIFGGGHNILIQGNFIGTDVNGTANLGNSNSGIDFNASDGNTVGGASAGAGNVIAFSVGDGLRLPAVFSGGNVFGVNNSIRGNSIFSNGKLGINLLGGTESVAGVTANDSCDADDGANHLQNFPVLTSANVSGGSTTIVGTLNSTASTSFTIDFYSNPACDASGNGEGKTYLGSATVNTDGSCNANINTILPVTMAAGQAVTATATDPNGNTSEFSSCATSTTVPPTVQYSASNYNILEDCTFVDLTVTRTGDTSGISTVDFATSDGGALQRTDYTIGSGTVSFAATETSKTFPILITQDHYVEGAEQLSVTLSNPIGATLGNPNVATVTINDDDTAQALSPGSKIFGGTLNGAQETPANNSAGRGVALVELSADETTANVSVSFSGLGSAETVAHIHGPGARGVSAPILFPLPNGNFNSFQISLTAGQVADLKAGLLYVNVHSNNFPNGEIRAQLEFNPIDDSTLFVGQHYHDFLARQADPGGAAFWISQITQCGNNAACVRDKRIDNSNAFFYELEFQQTGAYVYRLYRAAFGNNQPFPNPDVSNDTERKKIPDYLHFATDRARVVGGADLAQGQRNLANLFVQRPEFLAKYPASLDGSSFIDAVLNTIKNELGVDLTAQKPGLLTLFNSGGRGAVLYRLADDNAQTNPINNRAFIDEEYNRAFVATQYFGYLRRDSDIGGFLFWLGQVSSGPLRDVPKQHAMVCSFITSTEYQQRFSLVVTHTNADCPQ
jgi:hypothetical protein